MCEYRVQATRGAFVVLNAEGARVSPLWANRHAAERECVRMQAAFDQRVKRGMRACLGCGTEFHSEGIHNRLCGACKARAAALGREMAG